MDLLVQVVVVVWFAFWSKLMKKWWDDRAGNPALCVVSELWWAGKTHRDWDNIISPHRHRVCHEVWMWAEKKNGRQGVVGGDEAKSMCVLSTGSSSFLLHPFTFLHHGAKGGEKKASLCVFVRMCVYVRACVCVTSYSHKRFCILSALFILPFIWTVLFSADHLMSCPGLSCVGKKHSSS